MDNLEKIATPSELTCPECSGGLWEVTGAAPLRYRCHVGHAYSAQTLASSQAEHAEASLWSSVRALRERAMLLRRMANVARALGDEVQAAAGQRQADQVAQQADALMALAERTLGSDPPTAND